jgi:hypothetical protein
MSADGYWAKVAVPGVGIRDAFVPHDDLERQAAAEGLVTIHEAADQLGRSVEWAQTRIGKASGLLTVRTWHGRQWVEKTSVTRMVQDVGVPKNEAEARLEHLQAIGRGFSTEAMEISRRLEQDQAPVLDLYSAYVQDKASLAPPDVPTNPGRSFFEKFGRFGVDRKKGRR